MNKIYLIGRVVRDVEYVQTKTEKKMVNNSLAIDCGKDAGGNKQTMFVDITLFDKTAEIFKLYVEKGDKVAVNGELRIRDFTREDGSNGRSVNVLVRDLELIEPKKGNEKAQKPRESLRNYTSCQSREESLTKCLERETDDSERAGSIPF